MRKGVRRQLVDINGKPQVNGLPSVTTADNGKVMVVSNGKWVLGDEPTGTTSFSMMKITNLVADTHYTINDNGVIEADGTGLFSVTDSDMLTLTSGTTYCISHYGNMSTPNNNIDLYYFQYTTGPWDEGSVLTKIGTTNTAMPLEFTINSTGSYYILAKATPASSSAYKYLVIGKKN